MKRLLVFLALLFALPAWSATYYVDCAASGDSGAGTSTATAWKTVGRVNGARFNPGDSILFKRGCTWRESLEPQSSGASGNPITLGAYGTGTNPVISGADLVTGWTLYSGNVWRATLTQDPYGTLFINGTIGDSKTSLGALVNGYDFYWAANVLYLYAPSNPGTLYTNPGVEARVRQTGASFGDYLVYDGITVEKAIYSNFRAFSGGGHCIIRNCVSQYGGMGLATVWDQGDEHTGSEIYNNVFRYNNAMGISLTYKTTHMKVYRNECYENDTVIRSSDSWTAGIKAFGDGLDGIEIYENYVHDNGPAASGRGVGIWVDYVHPVTSPTLIHHNYVRDSRGGGIFVEISSDTHVWGNVIEDCAIGHPQTDLFASGGLKLDTRETFVSNNNLFYNNTVYGGPHGIVVTTYSHGAGMQLNNNIFKNNIVVGQTVDRLLALDGGDNVTYGSGNVYEYNCFGAEATNFIRWAWSNKSTYGAWEAAYGGSTYSVRADPQLTNPAGGDFTLGATSPCIDAGADLGPSYSTALRPGSSWPSNVRTGDQYRNGQRWEIGAYLFPAPAPPPGLPTATPTPRNIWPTPTPTPTPVVFAASFTFSPPVPTRGQQVQFTDTSSGASVWNWDFGDGSLASVRNPRHTYDVRGTYTVVLWVGNGVNWFTAVKTVTVVPLVRKHLLRG